MNSVGRLESIHLASEAAATMTEVSSATAIAGRGLEGDRYEKGIGHWSAIRRSGDELTLIEAEEIDRIVVKGVLDLPPGSTRRNLTTRGVRLDALIGRRFRVGSVTCLGVRRCEPCTYLDGLLGQDALPALVHRGGIRAKILSSGTIRVGDAVESLG